MEQDLQNLDRSLSIFSESDLMSGNVDLEEVLKIYRQWKKSEGIIRDKNKEINMLRHRLKEYDETNVQYRGQMQVIQSVKGLAVSYDDQLQSLKDKYSKLENDNRQLLEMNQLMERAINEKINDESIQFEKISVVLKEFKLLSEKYTKLQQKTSENDNIVATAVSAKKSFESQIIMLENKISVLNDENYDLKSKLQINEQKLANCDKELAHASNQLCQLSLDLSNLKQIQINKEKDYEEAKRMYPLKRDLNPWELELLHNDITRLLHLIEYFPTSETFLLQWRDSQHLSYIGTNSSSEDYSNTENEENYFQKLQELQLTQSINTNTNTNTINNINFTNMNNMNYSNIKFPYNTHAVDDERYSQSWTDAGFKSSAELSHIKRVHGSNYRPNNIPQDFEVRIFVCVHT